MDQNDYILCMEEISKEFPGVKALDNVTLHVRSGEIHALVGENGAGKSTLMKILSGALPGDSGKIILKDKEVNIDSPRTAQHLGISIIHQELATVPYLTVGQNIYLGREPCKKSGLIDWPRLYAQAHEQLKRLHLDIDPMRIIADLPIAQQQMVEVAKALSFRADIIVMDEPTSSLTERETETLFEIIRKLKSEGIAIIYISHRLEEVFILSDQVTVLRDGQLVGSHPTKDMTSKQIVSMMVGRELEETQARSRTSSLKEVLRVRGLKGEGQLGELDLELYQGEIVGVAGLVGAGRTELARALFGIDPIQQGQIFIEEQPVNIHSPQDAIKLGMGLVPEDRKEQGLFLGMSVQENITIEVLETFSTFLFSRIGRLGQLAQEYVEKLQIRISHLRQTTRTLSGGNQQKVVIARWLTLQPKILILDEPTRGIDVGAKMEIYTLIHQLAAQGVAILMISSELPEILRVSDRILVMRQGKIVAQFSREEVTQDEIMHYALGTN